MSRLRLRFLLLGVVLLVPIGLLIQRTLESVEFERRVRHEAVAERVFDEMERALSALLAREEARPYGHYRFYYRPEDTVGGVAPLTRSPLASLPEEPFIVGSFQVDPDQSVHTPLRPRDEADAAASGDWQPSAEKKRAIGAIDRVVGGHWHAEARNAAVAGPFGDAAQSPGSTVSLDLRRAEESLVTRLESEERPDSSVYSVLRELNKGVRSRANRQLKVTQEQLPRLEAYAARAPMQKRAHADAFAEFAAEAPKEAAEAEADDADERERASRRDRAVTVELAPMVGRVIDEQYMLVYRTVLVGARGYRQGFLVELPALHLWLREQGLGPDANERTAYGFEPRSGLAEHAQLSFSDPFTPVSHETNGSAFVYRHRFAEPFDDLGVTLALTPLPVGGAAYVYAVSGLLLLLGAFGLWALYRMVAVAMRFAERRSNFAAAVSHELKTPLTAIRMYGEMLRDDLVPSEAKRREYYGAITAESERLGRLINNVLEFSKLDNGRREMSLLAGDVTPVLEEAAELLRPHVQREGFELELEIDGELPPMRFDPDALVQVMFNLVDNALKYARDSGDRRVAIRCWRHGDEVRIRVRDHGPGVPAAHLGRIFEPFYRAESELTRRSQGTGIGLSLVRSLVEQMGGRVSAQNAEPDGFEVRLAFDALAPTT